MQQKLGKIVLVVFTVFAVVFALTACDGGDRNRDTDVDTHPTNTTYTAAFQVSADYSFRNEADTDFLPGTIGFLESGATVRFRVRLTDESWVPFTVTATGSSMVTGPVNEVYTLTVNGNTSVWILGPHEEEQEIKADLSRYRFFFWSRDGILELTGNAQSGYAITVEAGDTVHANVLIDDHQIDMFYIWFIFGEVNLGNLSVTADSLGDGYVRCDPTTSKWLILPGGLTGSVVIELWDRTGTITGGEIFLTTLTVTVIDAD